MTAVSVNTHAVWYSVSVERGGADLHRREDSLWERGSEGYVNVVTVGKIKMIQMRLHNLGSYARKSRLIRF